MCKVNTMKRLFITIFILSIVSCVSNSSAENDSTIDPPAADSANTINPSLEEMKYRLIHSDVAIVNQYGEDSIVTDENGNLSFLYPTPDTIWFNSEVLMKE